MISAKATINSQESPYGRLGGRSPSEAREAAAEQVRQNPGRPEPRQVLADLYCLDGQWEKALKQMQTASGLDAAFMPEAFVCRLLIMCEALRAEVLGGRKTPVWHGRPPQWAAHLQEALALGAKGGEGNVEAMDAARKAAFDLVEDVAGKSNAGEFAWICDSDTRLGPVCEMIVQGQYRFVPFASIISISAEPPRRIRDLIWLPVKTRLKGEGGNGSAGANKGGSAGGGKGTGEGAEYEETPAFIPARYPGSEAASDEIRLGRRTEWRELGNTGVFGLGQKTWMTDQGDIALLDLRELMFF